MRLRDRDMFHLTDIRSDDELQRNRGESFLLMNPDPGVRLRPKDQLDLAMSTGQGMLGSDGPDGRICGISLIYQFDPGLGPVSYEMGSMLVTAEGFGLQTMFASLHLMHIWLADDVGRGDVFAVVSPKSASEHNLLHKVGMVPWTPPATLALMRAAAGTPFVEGKRVLLAGESAIKRAFESLRGWHVEGNVFATPKKGEPIELNLGWFTPELLEEGP